MIKILVAAKKQAQEVLRNALEPEFDLIFCENLEQAKLKLKGPVDLIMCTVLFDGSRMFEFLRHVRANPATGLVPFVGARAVKGTLPLHEVDTTRIAAKLLGANDFIDLCSWIGDMGENHAFEKLRATVRQLL